MWGVWGNDDRGTDPNSPPFEIPAQGLGVFSCRKDSWLGFNPGFTGFGGEEGYIHTKYKQAGRGTLCLPFLRWMHRFERPNGVRYPLNIKDRIINYMIGFNELGLDTAPVREHFNNMIPQDQWINIESTVESKDVTTISPIDSLVKSSS
jgi:hypothetical protein